MLYGKYDQLVQICGSTGMLVHFDSRISFHVRRFVIVIYVRQHTVDDVILWYSTDSYMRVRVCDIGTGASFTYVQMCT